MPGWTRGFRISRATLAAPVAVLALAGGVAVAQDGGSGATSDAPVAIGARASGALSIGRGQSAATVSLELPAGAWSLTGYVAIRSANGDPMGGTCGLRSGGVALGRGLGVNSMVAADRAEVLGYVELTTAGTVDLVCSVSSSSIATASVEQRALVAVPVDVSS